MENKVRKYASFNLINACDILKVVQPSNLKSLKEKYDYNLSWDLIFNYN